jgi:uncharacterized protein YdeI (YjbR/CyaY-like superfamily)
MPATDYSRLKRKRYPMPRFVMDALLASKVREHYFSRPAYQQNDYIGWIMRAKQEQTKQKRLAQMIYELKDGWLYMKMKHNPKKESIDGLRAVPSRENEESA